VGACVDRGDVLARVTPRERGYKYVVGARERACCATRASARVGHLARARPLGDRAASTARAACGRVGRRTVFRMSLAVAGAGGDGREEARARAVGGGRERESAREFVRRKREIFLAQMDIECKLGEIDKLEAQAARREEALRKSERMLEEDHARFDQFLKDNDARMREAVSAAEREARAKHEKMREMKRLQNEIATATQELHRKKEKLNECRKYKDFLDDLTPSEWFERRSSAHVDGETESRGEDEMYFTEPEQLLAAFGALEEQNLFLIRSVREREEMLQRVETQHNNDRTQMDGEMKALREQIRQLQDVIDVEERKSEELSRRLRMGDDGNEDDIDKELKELTRRVTEVYVDCGFDHDPSISVLQMLTNIESKMEEYFAAIEKMPADVVADLEKQKEKDRRRAAREEKTRRQQAEQELRFKRSLERARAPAHKKTGKPIMFRSRLPPPARSTRSDLASANAEAIELEEFLSRQY